MIPALIGMVHLGPLPGAPRYGGDMGKVLESATRDARVLADAGFDAVMVENFGDVPFYADDVPKVTVAAMTRAVAAIADAVSLPLGVNVLRNDARAALAVAAATGAALVRVNVLSGTMFTDQGAITGRAADVSRERAAVAPGVRILADVFVKHAVPPAGLSLGDAAADLVVRGLADAVIVSGPSTGHPVDRGAVAEVRAAIGTRPLVIGSGADEHSVAGLLEMADAVIVGTGIKEDGRTTAPVDAERALRFVSAARPGPAA